MRRLLRLALFACIMWIPSVHAQESIRLKVRTFTPRARTFASRHPKAGARGHFLIEFRSYPDQTIRDALTQRGIRIIGYVPDNTLMVSGREDADLSGLNVDWTGPLDATDKLSPQLAASLSSAYIAIFHSDVDMVYARSLIQSAGLDLIPSPYLLENQLVVSGSYSQLVMLAGADEVSYILPASADLITGAAVAGCAGALTEAGPIADYVLASSGWSKDSSGIVSLQYYFQTLTEKLDAATVESEVLRAFQEWERYAPIQLTAAQTATAARTIAILFARGAHGDNYPFDGPGGTLAHTFYPAPMNAESIAGDMHLDADEPWGVGSGTDLYSVVLHETGHALGLGHSDMPGAVMYPYYKVNTALTEDDIAGIQALYGAALSGSGDPGSTDTTTTTTASGPTLGPPTTTGTPSGGDPSGPALKPPDTSGTPTTTTTTTTTPTGPTTPTSTDHIAPALAIISPGSTIVSAFSASIAFSGTASDNVGVARVTWSTSNGDAGTASGTTAWSASVPVYVGTNVVTIRAYDAAGNSSWRAVTVVRH